MIFPRTSVSEEKHNIFRQSVQSGSENSHTDDVTLLEDQEQHLEAQPYLSGKYVNKAARSWVEARVDWRLQWFGALVVYILVLLAACFSSYRHQYSSVLVTTSTEGMPSTGGDGSVELPQIVLIAQATTAGCQRVTPLFIGVTSTPNSTSTSNAKSCTWTSEILSSVPSSSNDSYLFGLESCFTNCA